MVEVHERHNFEEEKKGAESSQDFLHACTTNLENNSWVYLLQVLAREGILSIVIWTVV